MQLKSLALLLLAAAAVSAKEIHNDQTLGSGPDIGAYEFGASVYWIPGFQFPHASTSVPPDGTKTAKADCDLMWLAGYKANRHDVYFGSSAAEVAQSTRPSKTLRGDANIFAPGPLLPGKTYFWRVDATRDGETIRGKVWSFTVQSSPQRQRQRREPRTGDTLSSHCSIRGVPVRRPAHNVLRISAMDH